MSSKRNMLRNGGVNYLASGGNYICNIAENESKCICDDVQRVFAE